jgi:hypothetical protein
VQVSDRVAADLDAEALELKRKRRFEVKGVPRELQPYTVAPRS